MHVWTSFGWLYTSSHTCASPTLCQSTHYWQQQQQQQPHSSGVLCPVGPAHCHTSCCCIVLIVAPNDGGNLLVEAAAGILILTLKVVHVTNTG